MFKSRKLKGNEDDAPPIRFNWPVVLVFIACLMFWYFLIYGMCQLVELRNDIEIQKSIQEYKTERILKNKTYHIAMFREIYGHNQAKIANEIKEVCKEERFNEWKLAVAIAKLETQLGEKGKLVGKNNLYNIKRTEDTYRNYETTRDSILDFINLLNTSHYYKEFQDSRELDDLFRYAEDPKWEWKVKNIMNKF